MSDRLLRAMSIRKHSITIEGHRTSLSVEDAFWSALKRIAESRGIALAPLIGEIDAERAATDNLSSAVRVFVLDWALRRSGEAAARFPGRSVNRDRGPP